MIFMTLLVWMLIVISLTLYEYFTRKVRSLGPCVGKVVRFQDRRS